ncbi:hypothetical protein RKD26_005074 [Streptomyces calvus]
MRKNVLNWRTESPVFQPSPWVSSVPVVGRGHLDQAGVVERLLHLLGDAGVQRADDAEDVLVADELLGVLLADGGLGLVVERFELELDAVDEPVLVGGLHRELGGVAHAEAEGREVAGQRGVDADHNSGLVAAATAVAAVVARPACGERERARRECRGEGDERTLTHDPVLSPDNRSPMETAESSAGPT